MARELIDELRVLARRKDLRSADRANMRRMLEEIHKGKRLSTEEVATIWSYIMRYTRGQSAY